MNTHPQHNPTSSFLHYWRSLPAEIRLQILEHVLIIHQGRPITANDYKPTRLIYKYSLAPSAGLFAEIRLPLLSTPEADAVFNLPQVAHELWYGLNTFLLGGPYILGRGEKAGYYPYLVPPRSAFAYLQQVKVHIRGDYGGWIDLAGYCRAAGRMPKLRVFEVRFVQLCEAGSGSASLERAFKDVGRLAVSTRKLVVDYFSRDKLLGPLRPPVEKDRVDYPEAAAFFQRLSIEQEGEEVVKEEFRRYWDGFERVVEADERWALPPASMYPWQKHIVRTQWC
jgi:hypothetical protein